MQTWRFAHQRNQLLKWSNLKSLQTLVAPIQWLHTNCFTLDHLNPPPIDRCHTFSRSSNSNFYVLSYFLNVYSFFASPSLHPPIIFMRALSLLLSFLLHDISVKFCLSFTLLFNTHDLLPYIAYGAIVLSSIGFHWQSSFELIHNFFQFHYSLVLH